ncbi:MAG: hypothetical protein HY579_09510 [Nitrospinae bacterium]|nr:hypothetical protein [Nitrospinota bacterium]
MKTNLATVEVFFAAFKALKSGEREAFLEKVVSGDPELREDLMGSLMIEKARKVRGKSISAKTYFARREKTGKTV